MNFRFLINLFTGLAVGAFFFLWLYRSIDFGKLIAMSHSVRFSYILVGIGCYAAAICVRTFRWQKILNPCSKLKTAQVAKALIVGYAMNVILPARLGELFRANICKTWYSVPRSTALATIVIERISDGLTVLFCLFIGLMSLNSLHYHYEMTAMMLGGFSIFGMALLLLIFLRKFSLGALMDRIPRIKGKILNFQSGIRDLPVQIVWQLIPTTLLIWIFEGLSLWSLVMATGNRLDFFGVTLLIGVVSLSTLLPSPPGFLGTMQFAFAMALRSIGLPAESGVLAATITQIFLIGLVTVFGVALYAWVSLKNRFREREV